MPPGLWHDTSVPEEHPVCFETIQECRLAAVIAYTTVPGDAIYRCRLYIEVVEDEENDAR